MKIVTFHHCGMRDLTHQDKRGCQRDETIKEVGTHNMCRSNGVSLVSVLVFLDALACVCGADSSDKPMSSEVMAAIVVGVLAFLGMCWCVSEYFCSDPYSRNAAGSQCADALGQCCLSCDTICLH